MTLADWTLVSLILTAAYALSVRVGLNPMKGFISHKYFKIHPTLGFITLILAILTAINS